jgi:hypothetical protein
MTVLITLTEAGLDTGPFNLFSDADGYTTAFALGITKSALLDGYPSDVVPNGTAVIRVRSVNSLCNNYVDLAISGITTTTTTTVAFSNEISFSLGACSDNLFPDISYYISQTIQNVVLQNGDIAYYEAGFITPVDGLGLTYRGFFNFIKYQFVINSVGVLSSVIACPIPTTTTTTTV